jgi:2,2-dialkylglycine decarboxylase (pyruvate)
MSKTTHARDDWQARRRSLQDAVERHVLRYGQGFLPFFVERGEGCYIYDDSGRRLLDFTSGQMCATLGHNHPAVVAALERGCREVMHLFSLMLAPPVVDLCRELAALLPPGLQKVLLLSTGGESNEAALRLARMHSGRFEVVGLSASYHGLTGGAGALTFSKGRKGYGPVAPGALSIPAPNAFRCPVRHCRETCDLTCLEVGFEMIDAQSVGALAAVIAEPVLSSGGIIVPPPGYFPRLEELCRARGMLLILDEAQTGLGRLGANFAFEQLGVVPDILTLSKTLGGGLPLSATITSDEIEADCHSKGYLQLTSHVADPLPAMVGLAVLEVVVRERLAERAAAMGARLEAGLMDLKQRYEIIGDVRGRGLLRGVEMVKDRESREPANELGLAITRRCMELGLSMNIGITPNQGAIWRIAPPLTIGEEDIDLALSILDQAIRESL